MALRGSHGSAGARLNGMPDAHVERGTLCEVWVALVLHAPCLSWIFAIGNGQTFGPLTSPTRLVRRSWMVRKPFFPQYLRKNLSDLFL